LLFTFIIQYALCEEFSSSMNVGVYMDVFVYIICCGHWLHNSVVHVYS